MQYAFLYHAFVTWKKWEEVLSVCVECQRVTNSVWPLHCSNGKTVGELNCVCELLRAGDW